MAVHRLAQQLQQLASMHAAGTLKVIDFGLSKRYTDDQGRIIPRREGRAGFRGSTAYASIYAHEELEQGDESHLPSCSVC